MSSPSKQIPTKNTEDKSSTKQKNLHDRDEKVQDQTEKEVVDASLSKR